MGAAGTDHRDQVTDCKSILAIEARARAARPLKFHQRVLLSSTKTMQHKIRWHRSHPEKRDEPWSEDDIGVYMADMAAAGDRGGSRKGRVLQHFGQVNTEAVLRDVSGRALAFATHRGSINIRPIKEVVTVEVARSYRRARDVHREEATPIPRPPRWEGLNMRWASGVWGATRTMSLRRRGFITKVLYDKHFHGKNLEKFNNAGIDTTCKLCHSARDGQQHILQKCCDPAMVLCRRRQETSLHRKVCTSETKRDPMARFYRGYYNFAVDRRPDAHEFWTGVYSEPALLDLEGIELVIGDIPTDRQFNSLRRHCGHYAQAARPGHYAQAMFVERASRMGEIKAAQACAMTKVAGARAKPEDPVSHDIRKYATWPQQVGQSEGYRRRLLDSDDEDELALLPVD